MHCSENQPQDALFILWQVLLPLMWRQQLRGGVLELVQQGGGPGTEREGRHRKKTTLLSQSQTSWHSKPQESTMSRTIELGIRTRMRARYDLALILKRSACEPKPGQMAQQAATTYAL